jgi:hypothetical protein
MLFAVGIMVGSLVLGCFAVWMGSRVRMDDNAGKFIWAGMVIMCIPVFIAGLLRLAQLDHASRVHEQSLKPPAKPAPQATTTTSVTVDVTEGRTTTPIASATVRITFVGRIGTDPVTTDAQGHATLEKQPVNVPATITVYVRDEAGRTGSLTVSSGFTEAANHFTVPIDPSSPAGAPQAGTLSGTITNGETNAPSAAIIEMTDSQGKLVVSGSADNNGHYTFPNLPLGQYTVKFMSAGRSAVKTVNVDAASKSLDVTL